MKKHDDHGVSPECSKNAPRADGGVAEVGGAEELGHGRVPEGVRLEEEAAEGPAVEEEETRRPRICRRPLASTKAIVEEHNRTHAEYRDWCPDCRAGRSMGLHHRRGDPEEENLGANIYVDYAFRLKEEPEDDLILVPVACENVKESIGTLNVEEKGISNASVAVESKLC